MPKPGQSPNIANPALGIDSALSNVRSVSMGSRQDAGTTQTGNMDPNRLAARGMTTERAGNAEVERDGVMSDQTSNYTASQRVIDAKRRRIYG